VSYCLQSAQGWSLGLNKSAKRAERMHQMVDRADTERQVSIERSPSPLGYRRTSTRNQISYQLRERIIYPA